MYEDVTGIFIPGSGGKDCPGDGTHRDENGTIIECCCDECDYMLLCLDDGKLQEN